MPQTKLQVEMGNGFQFAVEHDVKTLDDFKRLLKKADKKIADACRVLPELREEKVVKATIRAEGPKAAAAAGS